MRRFDSVRAKQYFPKQGFRPSEAFYITLRKGNTNSNFLSENTEK